MPEALQFLSEASFWRANLVRPSAWIEHVPFAFWLVEALRPTFLVELGTHYGTSYCAFCQAVQALGLQTKCYAIDTWEGDSQSGLYSAEVFNELAAYNQESYSGFSTLVKSTFDDAARYFEDEVIDILHIDGLHTYDAARHDFEQWFPKLSSRAIVLFHDTNVRERDFGIFRLWKELELRWPSFEFIHGNGLGVLGVGADLSGPVSQLFEAGKDIEVASIIRLVYSSLGRGTRLRMDKELQFKSLQSDIDQRAQRIANLDSELTSRDQQIANLNQELGRQTERISSLGDELAIHDEQVTNLNRELMRQAERISLLGGELANRDEQITKLNQELRQNTESISVLGSQLASLNRELESRAQTVSALNLELAQKRSSEEHLRNALSETKRRGTELERKIDSMQESKSWQITKPLREMDHIVSAKAGLWSNLRDEATIFAWRVGVRLPIIRQAKVLRSQMERIKAEHLLDARWYREQYEGMPGACGHPILHYLLVGAKRGCLPNPLFDSSWYLQKHPEVRKARMNPLMHYVEYGVKFGFNPGPNFDNDSYLAHNPEAAASGANPLGHYLLRLKLKHSPNHPPKLNAKKPRA
ncbi:MAG: class I SAM-dependent methyltransferase [Verrucomicrobia bacterium]|nr:class I SAM-dependent methyltransferase [Verrucomicrobiota bacterium]